MDTIMNYLDNLFGAYPDTPKVRKAKEELLGIMEDKYFELKSEGKSENEAIGIVISEFGSMDEISFDLGLTEKKQAEDSFQESYTKTERFSLEQAIDFLQKETNFGRKIAVGVALCILSPTVSILMSAFADGGFLAENIAETIGASSLFLMVAVAVGIFIISGISHEKTNETADKQILLESSIRTKIEQQHEAYNTIFGIQIAAGVILCILSVLPVIFVEMLFDGTFLSWISELSALGLFVFVATGVFLFITAGMKKAAYETLLGKGKHISKVSKNSKGEKIIQIISAIYWPVITVLYLTVSFYYHNWRTSWIIWVVAGILFGGISSVISLVYEN